MLPVELVDVLTEKNKSSFNFSHVLFLLFEIQFPIGTAAFPGAWVGQSWWAGLRSDAGMVLGLQSEPQSSMLLGLVVDSGNV